MKSSGEQGDEGCSWETSFRYLIPSASLPRLPLWLVESIAPRNNSAQQPRWDIMNHPFKDLLLHEAPTEISQQN